MSPRLTKAMRAKAQQDGAEVTEKRKVQKPKPAAKQVVSDNTAEVKALRAEIDELKQTIASQQKAAEMRIQELSAMVAVANEQKPMRLKTVRDMDKRSPTYFLATHYDIVPVEYRTKRLDS